MSDEKPPEEKPEVDSDGIADAIFGHMSSDDKLSDEDRGNIAAKLYEKSKGEPPPKDVPPQSTHWTDKKLW